MLLSTVKRQESLIQQLLHHKASPISVTEYPSSPESLEMEIPGDPVSRDQNKVDDIF